MLKFFLRLLALGDLLLRLLEQTSVLNGSGGVVGESLQPVGVGRAELARPGAVHVQDAHRHAAHPDECTDVGAQPLPALQLHPFGVSGRVRDNDRLPCLRHVHQAG